MRRHLLSKKCWSKFAHHESSIVGEYAFVGYEVLAEHGNIISYNEAATDSWLMP